jgi:hypothetical protein
MNLASVCPEDIVLCDVRGDRFYALVREHDRQAGRAPLTIASLTGRPIPAYHVTARQVVGHWRKSKASRV